MSPQAVRVKTASGWQDIALQGAQGPAGRTPSCKASSSISFAAADTYYRGINLAFTSVFDDFGNSFSPNNVWTCRQTGRYLIIASYYGLSASGAVGLTMQTGQKMHSATVTKGADGNTWGTECTWIQDLTAGAQLSLGGYHSGGGTGIFIFEAIRLDAYGASEQHYAGISPGVIRSDNSGTSAGWSVSTGLGQLYAITGNSTPFLFNVTPTVNCWWSVYARGLFRTTTAAWYRLQCSLELMNSDSSAYKPDALGGQAYLFDAMHHSGAQDWAQVNGQAMWALTAGQTYRCRWVNDWLQGGNWEMHRNALHFYMYNMGARPRY